ncbi:unnamed protein product [Spirodela intermedia]|uniref:Uncharacterized protein n=1 Tax=Spirodela intermedia TaxID=51605 RepID=A0A7I8I8P9_SPIIN|nr:unnamed protein product [Spirodela intermedia]CAA6654009.1 unnamed protein product [Spirodela intermedia]
MILSSLPEVQLSTEKNGEGDRPWTGAGHAAVAMGNVSGETSLEMASLPQKHNPASTSDGSWSLRMDPLLDLINMKLMEPIADDRPRPSIWRVHPDLRKVEEEAYEPKLLAIGPLHHGKPRLHHMKQIKLTYLRGLLNRHKMNSLEKYIAVIRSCLRDAELQYSEKIELSDDEFVEMLVVDSCFIIEYLARRVLDTQRTRPSSPTDLLLLENQIPFLVLTELFNKTTIPLKRPAKGTSESYGNRPQPGHVFHLLHLRHMCLNPGRVKEEPHRRSCGEVAMIRLKKSFDLSTIPFFGLLYLIFFSPCCRIFRAAEKLKAPKIIPSTTELLEAGIKFEKVAPLGRMECYFKVSFKAGTLEIPSLTVDETTSALLRNLIALEQCCGGNIGDHFTTYSVFMDNIINTPRDVAILESMLGSGAEVADLFNMTAFCQLARHKWRASLVHDYFRSPWALVSLLAGFLLLAFTAVQAIFTVLRK